MKRGVCVELCGATAKAHHWGNADLLPAILVNTDAMARTTQLVQEGLHQDHGVKPEIQRGSYLDPERF